MDVTRRRTPDDQHVADRISLSSAQQCEGGRNRLLVFGLCGIRLRVVVREGVRCRDVDVHLRMTLRIAEDRHGGTVSR